MSPLKVKRIPACLAYLRLSPTRNGVGHEVHVVKIGEQDGLVFENDSRITEGYAGSVEIKDKKGETTRTVQIDVGDKAVIQQEGSPMAFVVTGEEWTQKERK